MTTPRGRAFRLTRDEKMFVQKLLKTKTNFHVFRTDQTKSMGDFIIVDTSSPQAERRKGYFVELKMGGGGAGNQLVNIEMGFEELAQQMPGLQFSNFQSLTGSGQEILKNLGAE